MTIVATDVPQRRLIVTVTLLAIALDQSATPATAPAFAAIARSFHRTPDALRFASLAFDVAYFVAIVTSLWCIARGGKRMFLTGSLAGYASGSVICALAPNLDLFTLGRFIEGASLGGFFTSGLLTLVATAPKTDLPLAMSMLSVVLLGAPSLAPLYAGLILDYGNWRELFALLALPAIVGALATGMWMKDVVRGQSIRFDGIAFVACVIATTAFELLIAGRANAAFSGALVLTIAVALAIFAHRELRVSSAPFCDLRVLGEPTIVRGLLTAVAIGVLVQFATLEAQFFGAVFHLGAIASGLILGSRVVGVAIGVVLLAGLNRRSVPAARTMSVSLAIFAIFSLLHAGALAARAGLVAHVALGIAETAAIACVFAPLASTLFAIIDRTLFASLVVLFKLSALVGATAGFAIATIAIALLERVQVTIDATYALIWCVVAVLASGTALLAASISGAQTGSAK